MLLPRIIAVCYAHARAAFDQGGIINCPVSHRQLFAGIHDRPLHFFILRGAVAAVVTQAVYLFGYTLHRVFKAAVGFHRSGDRCEGCRPYCGGFHPPAHHLFAGFFGAAVTGLRLVNSVKPSLLFGKLAVVLRGALVDLFRRPAGAADRNAFAVEAGAQLVKLRLLAFLLLG